MRVLFISTVLFASSFLMANAQDNEFNSKEQNGFSKPEVDVKLERPETLKKRPQYKPRVPASEKDLDEFLKGRSDSYHGIDAGLILHNSKILGPRGRGSLPPVWGGDSYADTENQKSIIRIKGRDGSNYKFHPPSRFINNGRSGDYPTKGWHMPPTSSSSLDLNEKPGSRGDKKNDLKPDRKNVIFNNTKKDCKNSKESDDKKDKRGGNFGFTFP